MSERLERFPFMLLFLVFGIYLGYQFYDFHFDRNGEVETHKAQMAAAQTELQNLKRKYAEGQRFLESLDEKRRSIQAQVRKLEEFQGAMSENLDVASLIKMLVTESKRSGLKVDKIEPGKKTTREFFAEQEFKISVHGTYVATLQFMQRVAQLQRILRVEGYTLKPQSSLNVVRHATLDAVLSVHAYQYVIGKEDKIGKEQVR